MLVLRSGRVFGRVNKAGFTIVELLIVIVVIGILAALVLGALSGVQRDARNAQTAHAIEAYKKGFVAYAQQNGAYPTQVGCLGQGYPGAKCWAGTVAESQALSDSLRTVMGNTLPLAGVGGNATGPLYEPPGYNGYTVVDGVPTGIIFYMIDTTSVSSPKCPVGPLISAVGWPGNLSKSNSVGATTSGNQCWVYLPQP